MSGIVDLGLLDQDEVWVDGAGVEHQIADMEPRYCRNVARFLLRRADEIAMVRARVYASVPLPQGQVAYDTVSRGLELETAHMVANPQGWLRDQPLLVALEARADGGAS